MLVRGTDADVADAVGAHPGALVALDPASASDVGRAVGARRSCTRRHDRAAPRRDRGRCRRHRRGPWHGFLAVNAVVLGTPPDRLGWRHRRSPVSVARRRATLLRGARHDRRDRDRSVPAGCATSCRAATPATGGSRSRSTRWLRASGTACGSGSPAAPTCRTRASGRPRGAESRSRRRAAGRSRSTGALGALTVGSRPRCVRTPGGCSSERRPSGRRPRAGESPGPRDAVGTIAFRQPSRDRACTTSRSSSPPKRRRSCVPTSRTSTGPSSRSSTCRRS